MRSMLYRLIGILLLTLVGACWAGCAKMFVEVNEPRPSAAPAPEIARIYFMLPQGFPGGQAWLLHDDKLVGYVQNRQYFLYEAPAGEHLFMLVSENTEGLKGDFEGGKSYYIRLFITPGILGTRVYWAPLEEGKENWDKRFEWLDACARVELNPPEADEWEQKYAARNAERLGKYTSGESEPVTFSPAAGE